MDQREFYFGRMFSRAKYAVARFRISFSSSSCRVVRRNSESSDVAYGYAATLGWPSVPLTFGPCSLTIAFDFERGWELVSDQPTASPFIDVVDQRDEARIDAMLDLATTVNTGAYTNVFRR